LNSQCSFGINAHLTPHLPRTIRVYSLENPLAPTSTKEISPAFLLAEIVVVPAGLQYRADPLLVADRERSDQATTTCRIYWNCRVFRRIRWDDGHIDASCITAGPELGCDGSPIGGRFACRER